MPTLNEFSHIINFVKESNRIEGIHREPIYCEVLEYERFMELNKLLISDLEQFVNTYQPGALLRDKDGMDVRIGTYRPPGGCIQVRDELQSILDRANEFKFDTDGGRTAFKLHFEYEKLHPFMDGNGRSGRMLWMWLMEHAPLGFLHTWYYQSLKFGRE